MAGKQFTHKELAKEMRKGTPITKGVSTQDILRAFRAGQGFWTPGAMNKLPPWNVSNVHLTPCLYKGKKSNVILFPKGTGFMVVGSGAEELYKRIRLMLEAPKSKKFKPTVPKKMK